MTKEMKIGLSVIGVLLAVFGTLLVRKLVATETDVAGGAAPEPSRAAARAADPAKKPQVIPQKNPGAPLGQTAWVKDGRPAASADDGAGDVPHPVYMPSSAERLREPAADDARQLTGGDEPDPVAPATHSNPFHRPASARPVAAEDEIPDAANDPPARLEEPATEPSALRTRQPGAAQPRFNPIRRASAEEPLNENLGNPNDPQPTDQAGADLGSAAPPIALVPAADDSARAPSDESRPASLGTPLVDSPAAESDAAQPTVQTQWQAGDRAASGVEPVMPDNGKYTVQPNDSLWSISEKVYGSGRYFKAIYEHNRSRLPRADKLAVGTVILVPPTATLEQNYPSLCPKQRKSAMVKPRTLPASTRQRGVGGDNVYVVEEGDTLFDIARYELGKASRWAEIYSLNRDTLGEDFDYLQPGTELVMPPKSPATDSFTRQRDSRIQR